jgi:hypothetical protein
MPDVTDLLLRGLLAGEALLPLSKVRVIPIARSPTLSAYSPVANIPFADILSGAFDPKGSMDAATIYGNMHNAEPPPDSAS